MHLKSLHATGFKRFTDLTIDGLSPTARLIVLAGPNGSGKSSFFDALKAWHWYNGSTRSIYDPSFHQKIDEQVPSQGWTAGSVVELHEDITTLSAEDRKKLVYIRSAYRNEADFSLEGLSQLPPLLESPRVQRTIDNDVTVSQNYQRLIFSTLSAVYDDSLAESTTRLQIRDMFIAKIRESLQGLFSDLTLLGVSNNPLTGGNWIGPDFGRADVAA